MPAYYTYLISSLPALSFGARPPFSFGSFIQKCSSLIPADEIDIISRVSLGGEYFYAAGKTPALEKWYAFDTALRNELVKLRAQKKKIDPLKYLRQQEGYADTAILQVAAAAFRNSAFLEAEKSLDLERWRRLEELALGHYFDLEFLVIYALKLLMLERWERINTAEKNRLLEDLLQQA